VAAEPDSGLVWQRAWFDWNDPRHVPLRLHVEGPQTAALCVNGTFIGRYVGELGPQHDFLVMDGLVRAGRNEVRLGVYATTPGALRFDVRPWRVRPDSGNLDDVGGVVFAGERHSWPRAR
jgi:hypothetical protein